MIFSSDKIQETWTLRQESHEVVTRVGGTPLGHAPYLVGPSKLHRRTSSSYIYIHVPPNNQGRSQKPNSTAATFCIHEIPSWGLFRSSVGGGIDHGGLLDHHPSSTDVLLPPIYTYVPPNDQIRSQNPNSTAVTFCIHEIPSWGLFWSSAERGHQSRRASTSAP